MGVIKRLRATLFSTGTDRAFEEETRFHLDELVDRYIADGMTPAEARRLAERRLGNLPLVRDRTRDADSYRWLSDGAQDLRFALRTLRHSPAFTIVAVVTLALGIGANTAIFTLFDTLLLRRLPVRDPSTLVLFTSDVGEGTSTGSPPTGAWSLYSRHSYQQLRDQPIGLASLAAVRSGETPVLVHLAADGSGQPDRAQAHLVSGSYFSTLGVDAAIGRTITPADDTRAASPAVVVSDGYWRLKLHGDPSALGRTVLLNKTAFTIVGIAPRDFFGERVRRPPDFWVPLSFQPEIELRPSVLEAEDTYWLNLIGRLAPGVPAARVQTAATTVLQRFLVAQEGAKLTPDRRREIQNSYVTIVDGGSGVSGLRRLYSEPLHVLLAVVGLLLLLACANVANLMLTRAAGRRGEIAMRLALGAGRLRLIRQLLTESLVVAATGAVTGALVAAWAVRGLMSLIVSPGSPLHPTLSVSVLSFTAAVGMAAGLLFGIVPALQASRLDLVSSMKARQGSGAASGGRAAQALVALQIALSLVLVVGALLFARSLGNLEHEPLGFDASHVLLVRMSPRLAGYTPASATAIYRVAYDRLRALPGVASASFARYSPFSGSNSVNSVNIEGYTPRPGEDVEAETIQTGPSYPEAMGLALVSGREIGPNDVAGAPLVAMVNEAFVRRYYPAASPLGRHIGFDSKPNIEIVGVLRDARFHDARHPVPPAVFPAMLQETSRFALDCEFALRTSGDPEGAAAETRDALAQIAHEIPLNDPLTLETQVSASFASQRLASRFVSVFGLLALALACVGLYGTVAQNVTQRSAEIGVRMALGARSRDVLWLILRQTALLLAVGVVAGVPLALGAGRIVAGQLFGVRPIDPVSLGGAVLAMAAVAIIAGLVPARRATRINAVQALRGE